MLKWFKYRSFRLDSHYALKILIIFNIFLGLYLLFLSTNYRKYVKYPHDNIYNHDDTNSKSDNYSNLKNSKLKPVALVDPVDQPSNQLNDANNKQTNNNKNNDLTIDKSIFDSNNHPVVQDLSNADTSYKRVEEDDKTIDENDKLKIEMLGAKPDEQNTIIHLDIDFNEKNKKTNDKSSETVDDQNKKDSIDDLNKDVIKQIIDHNSHIKKNYSKLIVPDNINLESLSFTPETRGKYKVLSDYISGNAPIESKTVTLTTQGGPSFLYHAEKLCSRWEGPISLAVYAPGDDFRLAINIIFYLRQCADKCVAERIFWHLIYDSAYPPTVSDSKIAGPTSFLETQKFDCNIPWEKTMESLKINSDFRKAKSLPYPINVLRNVARLGSKSKYLLASDIELYPNVGVVPAFLDLLEREQKGLVHEINPRLPHVYVLPIFEVKSDRQPPKTKEELSKLFEKKDAIFFHRYVCDLCQNFPDREIWVKEIPKNGSLNIFRVTKRTRLRSQWEPLYIGTNAEPFYDERLTWEGKRDKMSQMYHMCLMNYDLLILDNAFLVHAPGIKRYNVKDDKKRLHYIYQNHKIYLSVLADLRKKYGTKNHC